MTDQSKVVLVPLSEIRPAPENDQLYRPISQDDPEIDELARSIERHGLREPIVVTADYWILSGHRRHAACCRLGLECVAVRVESIRRSDDIDGFVVLLREYNRQRDKSLDEKLREELVSVDTDEAYRRLRQFRNRTDHLDTKPFAITGEMKRRKISSAKGPFLKAIQEVITQRREFWPLSDRLIHYALLNAPPLKHASKPDSVYDNTPQSYRALVELLTRARLTGQIPFDAIADETRPVSTWNVYDSPQPFIRKELNGFLRGYFRDLQRSQPDHVELIVEKNTLRPIIKAVAAEYCVPMTSGRGYCSLQPRRQIAERFWRTGKSRLVLVIVSDFDPDGEEISQSLARSLRDDFAIDGVYPIKAALTRQQTQQLNLPTALKAKASSANFKKFVAANGSDDCWEVEAIPPKQLQDMVRDALNSVMDLDLLNAETAQEKTDAARLTAARKIVTKSLSSLNLDGADTDDDYALGGQD